MTKKTDAKPKTDAQKTAQKNYMSKFARVELRMLPEQRDAIQAHADAQGESVNHFILRAIGETIERDTESGNE